MLYRIDLFQPSNIQIANAPKNKSMLMGKNEVMDTARIP